MAFRLTVSSPDGNKFGGNVTASEIGLPVKDTGELAVMAGHIPFVTSVVSAPCTLWFEDGSKKTAICEGGLLTVDTDRVNFISGSFEFTKE